jgi:hypothetical protein
MAKKELFQSVLNNMLEQIRLDAIDCLEKPPEKEVDSYNLTDLSDKALEYHTKGETGTYLYFMALLEMKSIEKDITPTDKK